MSYFRPMGATSRDQRADQVYGQSAGGRTSGSTTKSGTSFWSKLSRPGALPVTQSAGRAGSWLPRPPASAGQRATATPPSRKKKHGKTKPMTTPVVSTRPGVTSSTTSSGGGGGGGGGGGVLTAPAPESAIEPSIDELDPAPADELEATPAAKKSLSTGAKVGIGLAAAFLLVPAFFNK